MLESCTNTNYRVVHPYKLESRARLCCAYTLIHTCVYVHADEEEFTRQTHKQFEKLCEIQGGVTVIDVHKLMEVCVLELTCARVMYCEYITCAQNSPATHCNTLPHTATYCKTLHHIEAHCNTPQHTATHGNTLQHTATHGNTLQHTATHCNTLHNTAPHRITRHHTATRRNTLQHIAMYMS